MAALNHLGQLSAPRQALIGLFQSVNFGQILGLVIRKGNPVFQPEPSVLLDVKLDTDEGQRPEASLADLALRDEVRRLLAHLDRLQNVTVERTEVRSGVPRRVIIARRLKEAS
jgi:hypothetical protein